MPHHEALVGLSRGTVQRNHDLVEAIINQQFYVALGEKFAVRDHTHIGDAALFSETYYLGKILIERRFGSAPNNDHERPGKKQRRDACDLLIGKDALVGAHVFIVAEIAHSTAQITRDHGIEPDDEMAETDCMSKCNSHKFQARIVNKTVQLEQSVHGPHGATLEHQMAILPVMTVAR